MVFLWLFLITDETEHLFICLLAIRVSFNPILMMVLSRFPESLGAHHGLSLRSREEPSEFAGLCSSLGRSLFCSAEFLAQGHELHVQNPQRSFFSFIRCESLPLPTNPQGPGSHFLWGLQETARDSQCRRSQKTHEAGEALGVAADFMARASLGSFLWEGNLFLRT